MTKETKEILDLIKGKTSKKKLEKAILYGKKEMSEWADFVLLAEKKLNKLK